VNLISGKIVFNNLKKNFFLKKFINLDVVFIFIFILHLVDRLNYLY